MAGEKEKAGSSKIDRLNTFCLDGRLESFKLAKWPQFSKSILSSKKTSSSVKFKITPETMANAGFHAKPIEGSVDNACCGYCKKNLDGWGEEDVAWDEHVSHSGVCPLVNLGEQVSRELSFTLAGWPHTGSIGPSKMAKAGFFFWPKLESEDDTAVCVQCGLALDGWEPNDDPRHEHSRRRPNCPFLVTGKTHSPAHFELLFASKNTDEAMKEFKEHKKDTPKSIKKEKVVVEAAVTTKKVSPPKKVVSPPKFKMPVSKTAASAIPVVSKDIEATPKVNRSLLKPVLDRVEDPEATVKRVRTSTRRSSIRHAEPTFKTPVRLDDQRQSLTFSLPPSIQATPLTKRTAPSVRKPRASSIKPVSSVPEPPSIDHAKLALDELAASLKPLKPSKSDLSKPIPQYLQSLIDAKIREFDEELGKQLANFDSHLAMEA